MLVNKKYISTVFSEAELKERNKALGVVYDIASDLTSSLSLSEIMDRSIGKIREHFSVDVVRMYLMDETGKHMKLAAYKGLTREQVGPLRNVPLTNSFSGRAAREKSFIAQRVSDLDNEERALLLHHVGLEVIICVPLIIKNVVVGVMNLGAKQMIALDQEKIDLLVAIGNQIAVAVNVAKLHEDVWNKAQEIQRSKEQLEFFAYSVAHDLKNPAVGVLGFAELLAKKYEGQLDERGKKYCRQIKLAAEQIEGFIRDINDYIASKKVSLNLKKTDVGKVIRHIKDELAPILDQRQILLTTSPNMPEVIGDESAMTRAFKNLIDNALKHGGANVSRIKIDYDESRRHHIFSFNNDGRVIADDGSNAIFEMFQKDPGSACSEGSGLGLAIVKQIAEAHKGSAWFTSNPEDGTTFYVSILKDLIPETSQSENCL